MLLGHFYSEFLHHADSGYLDIMLIIYSLAAYLGSDCSIDYVYLIFLWVIYFLMSARYHMDNYREISKVVKLLSYYKF